MLSSPFRRALMARVRHSSGLPFRIRAPLAKLQERKARAQEAAPGHLPPALGDGEKLESSAAGPDYVRMALTSRVYDMVQESPLQFASGLSARFKGNVHIKREDLLPSFTFKIRGTYNLLADIEAKGGRSVITYSVGSQGHSAAVAASRLGMKCTIVMPERTPVVRRRTVEHLGATVIVHGKNLADAQLLAESMADEAGSEYTLIRPHDDERVIAGQATVGLEVVRQHGQAMVSGLPTSFSGAAAAEHAHLDAIFVCVGGGSLLAGVAAAVKQIMPGTKVIGVEPSDYDVLNRSLLSGHRVTLPEPGHFVDGAAVREIGPEVFRVCNELVDDLVTVSNDEICAAVRDCFEDTRAMLEPAGAISVAGLKKYLAARPAKADGSKGNFIAISSDASNIEFDILRFIADRASIGEQTESLFALEVKDQPGTFLRMYSAVQPRLVTEFVYRHTPNKEKALIYMALERADPEDRERSAAKENEQIMTSLREIDVEATDITGDDLAKTHARYLAGGRPGEIQGERIIRFEFPETPGALASFLRQLRSEWFITLLHYRNHGGQVGKVLAGVRVPDGDEAAFEKVLDDTGYTFFDETHNLVFEKFMR